MSGIVLNTTFNNSNLPVATSFAEQILAIAGLLAWFQADVDHTDLVSGKISVWRDRAGGALTLAQATAAQRANLLADALAGYSVADFPGAGNTNYALAGGAFDATQPFSWALAAKFASNVAAQTLFGTYTNSTTRAILNLAAAGTDLRFQYGTSNLLLPIEVGAPLGVIVAFDGTNLKGSINGVSVPNVTKVGSCGSANLLLGLLSIGSQLFTGQVADVLLFGADVFASGDNDKIDGYFSAVYGIGA